MSYSEKNKSIRGSSYEAPPNLVNPQQPNIYTTPAQAPPQAETIMIECNRATAIQTEDGLNSDYHRWTCEFPNGIQLKTGDEVRVNSAYLSSIGVGDLISWDKTGENQNNTARWIHSFYCSNDGKNDKREGYNIKGGKGVFYYDIDNRPAQLHRVIDPWDKVTSTRPSGRVDIGWYEDPYMPMRFFGLEAELQPPYCVNASAVTPKESQEHPQRVFWIHIENDGTTGFSKLIAHYINNDTATYPSGITRTDHNKLFTLGQSILISQPNDDGNGVSGTGNSSFDADLSGNGNNVLGCFTIVELDPSGNFAYIEPLNDIINSGQKLEGAGKIQVVQRLIQTKRLTPTSYEWFATGIWEQEEVLLSNQYGLYQFQMIGGTDEPSNVVGYATQVTDSGGDLITAVATELLGQPPLKIQVVNLAVGGNVESIQIKFDDTNISGVEKLLQFNNYHQTLSLKIERINGTFEYITAYILKGQHNGNRNGTITHISDTTFQLDKVRRQINETLTIPTPTQPIVNNGNNIMYRTDYGVNVKYALSLSKQERITLSKEYGTLAIPTDNQKIYYGLLSRPNETFANSYTLVYNPLSIGNDINNAFQIGGNLTRDINYQLIGYLDGEENDKTVPHYEFFDYIIEDDYSSPSDIATDLTKQTHNIGKARNKYGVELINTERQGLLQNKFCIPVWTSFDASNVEVSATGTLGGRLEVGSFVLKHNIYNLPQGISNNNGTPTNTGVYPTNGETTIYFRTKNTTRNRPTDHTHTWDFYQLGYEQFSRSEDETGAITGFPIRYINDEECYASQYIGTNNLTFSWDSTDSRFNIGYAHQPHISTFSTSSAGVSTGGQISAVVYYPSPQGKDGFKYKLPKTRCGGINIENWNAIQSVVGEYTPQQIIDIYGVTPVELADIDNFWGISKVTSKNFSAVGERFWTKLGFTNQLKEGKVGWEIDPQTGLRTPVGTTDNLLDVADSILFTEPSAENTPFYKSIADFGGDNNNIEAQWKYASRGGLFTNNHNKGYGLPNTTGRPIEFIGDKSGGSDYDPLKSTFNPDRNWWNNTGYTIETETDFITADQLPIKTELGYYFIMSDIIKTNFFVSKGGCEVNVLGTLSKLNSAGDFVFQYQAPQVFYAKEDRLLTSITTEIRTPSLGIPVALSPYSSVLYQIVRYNPQPQPLELPVWYRQEVAFNQIENNLQMIAKEKKAPLQDRVEAIMEEVLNAVNQPDEQQATLMESLVEEYDRLELQRFRGNPRGLRQFITENPEAEAFLTRLQNLPPRQQGVSMSLDELREQAYSLYPRGEEGQRPSRTELQTIQEALQIEEPTEENVILRLQPQEEEYKDPVPLPYEGNEVMPFEELSFEERRARDYYLQQEGMRGTIVRTEENLRRLRREAERKIIEGEEEEEEKK